MHLPFYYGFSVVETGGFVLVGAGKVAVSVFTGSRVAVGEGISVSVGT